MVKLTPIVVHIVTGLVIQYTTSFAAPICQVDEYWQSVLGKCLPCRSICKTLEEKDCRRLCWRKYACLFVAGRDRYARFKNVVAFHNLLVNPFLNDRF